MSQILILPIVLVANNICNLVQVLLKFILFRVSGVGCRMSAVGCRVVSGCLISQNYNQLSQAKVKAETEFGNMLN